MTITRSNSPVDRQRAIRGPRAALWLAATLALCVLTDAGRADDVNITTSAIGTGFNLDPLAGTTVKVFPGVTVNNVVTLIPGGVGSTFPGIFASNHAWTLTNQGTIGASFGNGVFFKAGGTVVNSAAISGGNGIWIEGAAGTVNNLVGGTIQGDTGAIFFSNVVGTVTNAGSITSNGQAVGLSNGGMVTNLVGGVIRGHADSNAVSVTGGTNPTVVNSGTIQGNDTGFATGVALDSGTLTNNKGGQILGAFNGVWANGSGATSVTNAGVIEASKAQGGGSAIEVDAGGTVVNSGTIRSLTSDSTTSDAGIQFAGAGTITNSGTITSLTGGLAINFVDSSTHTLILDTGSVLGGNVQGGGGTDNLILKGTGSETIAKFLSFETLSMQGTDWTLTGSGTFSTSTQLQSGTLHVNGVLTSPAVTVAAGATLAGTGTIIGNVANSGTISPGNSIGTLNITGNTSFASGSFLAVQANAAGAASKLVATGTATIGGGTVRALPQPGAYGLKTTYTILTANGGVTGTFANVTSSAFFTPSLTYDANDVFLTLARNTSFFASVAATPNQRSVGGALDASPFASTLVQAVLPLSAATAQQAFDALSGEIYASVQATLLDDSRYARQAILGRLRQAPYAGAPGALLPLGAGGPLLAYQAAADDDADALAYQTRRKPPFPIKAPQDSGARNDLTFWAQGFGTWGTFNGDGNAASLNRNLGGFISGVDRMSGDWRLGAAMGYTSSNNQVGARASSAQVDTIDLAAYAGRQFGALAVRTGAVLALHNIDVDRSIFFPGFADRATARFGASTTQIFGEAGYPVTLGRFAAEPFAGLAYVHLDMDKIIETGGPAALTGAGSTQDEGFSTLGVRAATAYLMQNGMMLIPRASIAWQHLIGQRAPTAVLAFQSTGAGFPVAGVPLARDGALIEAGFDLRISPRAMAGVFYTGQIASGVHDNGVKGRFSWLF